MHVADPCTSQLATFGLVLFWAMFMSRRNFGARHHLCRNPIMPATQRRRPSGPCYNSLRLIWLPVTYSTFIFKRVYQTGGEMCV